MVRRSTSDGGGHGNPIQGYEILHTNIEEAITTLGFNYIAFNYTQYESPQSAIYLSWLKQQLLNGYPVVWFIMCQGIRGTPLMMCNHTRLQEMTMTLMGSLSTTTLSQCGGSTPTTPSRTPLYVLAYSSIRELNHDTKLQVYPDDVLVHGSDYAPDGAANLGYFRRFDSLVDTTAMDGNCSDAQGVYTKNEVFCKYPHTSSNLRRRPTRV